MWVLIGLLYYKDEYCEVNNLHLVHNEDQLLAVNFTGRLCKVLCMEGEYYRLECQAIQLRVLPEAIKFELPDPYVSWGDSVLVIGATEQRHATISEVFWHYKQKRYFYLVSIDGEARNKRYYEEELLKYP